MKDKNDKKISVIIPHYKDFDGLKRLIPTIPQKVSIEVILIDDNSYPGSNDVRELVESFGRDDIILLYNDINKRGAGCCRNIGIDNSKGKWLVFADSDDFFTENAFDSFEQYTNSEADYIHFHVTSINLPEGTLGSRHIQNEYILNRYCKRPSRSNELILRFNIDSPCAKMVKRSFVINNQIRYDEIKYTNDTMFAVKIGYHANRIDAADDLVYIVTRNSNSMTSIKSMEARKCFVDSYVRKLLYMRERLSYQDFRKTIRWPGYKIVNGLLDGYGQEYMKYAKSQYKDNGISLWWINSSDLRELYVKLVSYFIDRKYTKV